MHKFSMKAVAIATVIGGAMAGAVSASAALNLPTQNCSYSFNTNMKLGSRGTSVMNLQKVLNAYPQTQIAASGAGSPGMETTYFGAATRAAVNKFQALHLVELGITAPTGNVFAGTRGLLNQVCNGTVSTTPGTTGGTVTSGPVSAMLAAAQPTGLLVQGQAGARLADFTFSGNGTVTSVQLQRSGVSTNSTLVNVYLYDGNTRITDAASVTTGGFITFNSPNGLFAVNGSRTITVRADLSGTSQGQSVGVNLVSVTAGGAVSTFSNVMGNTLQVANVSTASVNFSALDQTAVDVTAGTTNYTVWSGSATVSTRDVNLRAATFKFIGSAPVDSVQNLSLYVDGTKVAGPSAVNAANNNKLTFDLGATPYVMKTGAHTIEVRGDVVKGSARNFYFTVENVADLMFEDSNLAGVNVSATSPTTATALTQSTAKYRTISVLTGSATVTTDPAFNATKVTGGATNVPIAQFIVKAYGEDVKVNSLTVTPTLNGAAPYNGGLANVGLYVNGGQVGTSQNWNGSGALPDFNLGSSMIVPAGQSVTLTVKADIVNATSSTAYTAGTLSANVTGSSNAQGQSSNEIVTVTGGTGNVLTIGSGAGTFARTSGFSAVSVSPNTSNVKIGSFTLQANSSEDIRVNSIGVNPNIANAATTNISNLKVVSNGVTLGTPVGTPAAGTTTFSFADIIVPANGTRTFDVYADIGSDTSASTTAAMDITTRGVVSNTTTVQSAAGVAVTSTVSSLAASTLSASSPVAQFVVGGSTFGIATFTLKTASAGTQANVREMRFNVSTGSTDAIESVTVGGITAPVVNGTSTVTGLNITVGSTGTDVPVTVKYAGYQNSTSGGSLSTTVGSSALSLTYVEATSGSGSVIMDTTIVPSNAMVDVASKPTVTVSAGNVNTLVLGTENKIGEFTVTADANGKISLATTTLTVSPVNFTNAEITLPRVVTDGSATTTGAIATGSTTITIGFTPAFEIGAGQSKTFSVYATVNGVLPTSGTPYIASRLGAASTFQWKDVVGGNTAETGSAIYNYPTNSYTTQH